MSKPTDFTAHAPDDAAVHDVMQALEDHHGEATPLGRSINRGDAVLTIARVLAHLIGPYPDDERAGVLEVIGKRAGTIHAELALQKQNQGSA